MSNAKKAMKRFDRGYTIIELITAAWIVAVLAGVVFALVVLCHFIMKVW